MGLARAFTKRLGRPSTPDDSTKLKPTRPAISMPLGLISTTNQSVHDNPNISTSQIRAVQNQQRDISSSSGSSLNESDGNTSSSPDTPAMTDASSVESYSPIEPNHLTQYFPPVNNVKPRSPVVSLSDMVQLRAEPEPQAQPTMKPESQPEPLLPASVAQQDHAATEPASTLPPLPAIPKRAPSHSKHEHERLARVRSVRSSAGATTASSSVRESTIDEDSVSEHTIAPLRASSIRGNSRPASAAATPMAPPIPESQDETAFNPFSKELMQLDEVAEEFSGYSADPSWEQECREDVRVMHEKGLRAHRASEYLQDISLLRMALWDLAEEKENESENVDNDDSDDDEQFHDAVSDWI